MSIQRDASNIKMMANEITSIMADRSVKGYLSGIDIKLIEDLWLDIADIAFKNIEIIQDKTK
ncbi:MAG: hypothetical protein IPP74_14260 [Alphaproteobacteria bacterium]|nr:hypothetical protein [Alphaproteobacteria bacterium]